MIISNGKSNAKKLPNSYHSEIKVIFIEKNYWSYKKWKLNKIYCFKRFYVFLKAYLLLLRYIKTFVKYKPIKTLLGRIYFCEILFAEFPKKSANPQSRYKYHLKSHCGQCHRDIFYHIAVKSEWHIQKYIRVHPERYILNYIGDKMLFHILFHKRHIVCYIKIFQIRTSVITLPQNVSVTSVVT